MRTHAFIWGTFFMLAALAVSLMLSTCGGGSKRAMNPPSIGSGDIHAADSLDSALAELAALETPDSVDPEIFQQLKDALTSQLESRFSNRDSLMGNSLLESLPANVEGRDSRFGAKLASTPPIGEINRVNDLTITDNGDGTYALTWHYRNLGDYDQDGVVGISDIHLSLRTTARFTQQPT